MVAVLSLALALPPGPSLAATSLQITFHPARLRVGDVGWIHVRGVPEDVTVEGSAVGRSLSFFPYGGGQAALVGIDLDAKPGSHRWRIAVVERGREVRTARGAMRVRERHFAVQRLTLPRSMVDLDPETERRAVSESERLSTLYRTVSPVRLWSGPFTRPVGGTEPGTGFGSRRIINGQPRLPHSGLDFAAPLGTPVVAANAGRVTLVGEYFFPGRFVAIDHGLGLYTLYFQLGASSAPDLAARK